MQVFIDTSYFVARMFPRDQWHSKARKAASKPFTAITSSLIINETVSLLQARGLFSPALTFLREIRETPGLQIIFPDSALQSEAWDLFARWGGAGANAVDCVSFAVMRRLSLRRAFTFDRHFEIAGFDILR